MMITVSIAINGVVIMTKSVIRIEEPGKNKLAKYKSDCGKIIEHDPDDGAINLSHKMLDLLHEYDEEGKRIKLQRRKDNEKFLRIFEKERKKYNEGENVCTGFGGQ